MHDNVWQRLFSRFVPLSIWLVCTFFWYFSTFFCFFFSFFFFFFLFFFYFYYQFVFMCSSLFPSCLWFLFLCDQSKHMKKVSSKWKMFYLKCLFARHKTRNEKKDKKLAFCFPFAELLLTGKMKGTKSQKNVCRFFPIFLLIRISDSSQCRSWFSFVYFSYFSISKCVSCFFFRILFQNLFKK